MSLSTDQILRSVLAPMTPMDVRREYREYSERAYGAVELLAEPRRGRHASSLDLGRIANLFRTHDLAVSEPFLWLRTNLDWLDLLNNEEQQTWVDAFLSDLHALDVARLWPNLPLFPQSVSTVVPTRADLDAQISLVGAAGASTDGQGVTWAIIDTDVDDNHDVLRGKPPDRYKVVPGGPSTPHSVQQEQPGTFQSASTPSHGTHIAGIIRTLAPAMNIITIALPVMQVTVGGRQYTGFKDAEHLTAALKWLNQEHQNGTIKLAGVNLSLGQQPKHQDALVGRGPGCPALNDLCEDTDAMVVVAAGNYGEESSVFQPISITDPANAYRAVVVGACDRDKPEQYGLCTFSSRGPTADGRNKPDLLGPGLDIVSCGTLGPSQYETQSGTSQAAAFVSGVLAVLRGAVQANITNKQIVDLVREKGNKLERPEAWVGGGLVDAQAVLDEAENRGWLKP